MRAYHATLDAAIKAQQLPSVAEILAVDPVDEVEAAAKVRAVWEAAFRQRDVQTAGAFSSNSPSHAPVRIAVTSHPSLPRSTSVRPVRPVLGARIEEERLMSKSS
jgi:hypothetical protein